MISIPTIMWSSGNETTARHWSYNNIALRYYTLHHSTSVDLGACRRVIVTLRQHTLDILTILTCFVSGRENKLNVFIVLLVVDDVLYDVSCDVRDARRSRRYCLRNDQYAIGFNQTVTCIGLHYCRLKGLDVVVLNIHIYLLLPGVYIIKWRKLHRVIFEDLIHSFSHFCSFIK